MLTPEQIEALFAKASDQLSKLEAAQTRTDALIADLVKAQLRTDAQIEKTNTRLEELMAKTDAQIAQTNVQIAETNARLEEQIAKTDAQIAQTNVQIAETNARLEKQIAKTDAQIEKTNARLEEHIAKAGVQIAEAGALLKTVVHQHGNFSNNQGRITEAFFVAGLKKNNLTVGGTVFNDITPNVKRQGKTDGVELDAVLTNGSTVGILETKTVLHVNDVEKVQAKVIPAFRKHFGEFSDKTLMVMVAGELVNDDARALAYACGFVCLTHANQELAIDASHARFLAS